MATKNVRSIEEQVEDWCKTQLRSIKYTTNLWKRRIKRDKCLRNACQ